MVSLVAASGINLYPKRSHLSFVLISNYTSTEIEQILSTVDDTTFGEFNVSDIKTVPYLCYYSND